MMAQQLERVILTMDLPDHCLKQGDIGTVVLSHGDRGFEVEFVTLDGQTIAVVSLSTEQIRPIGSREIAHARSVDRS